MKGQKVELDQLTARRHEIGQALAEDKRTSGGTLTAEARRWLLMEQKHYGASADNDLDTWAAARARIEAAEALTDERTAARQAVEAEARAVVDAKAAEVEAAIRAKLAQEADPLTQWKRAHSDRTF